MDVQTQVIAASVFGAAAFSMFGYALARLRRGRLSAPAANAERDRARAELYDAARQIEALGAQHERLRHEIGARERRESELDAKLADASARLAAWSNERDSLRAELAETRREFDALSAERERLQRDAELHRRRASELERKGASATARAKSEQTALQAQIDELERNAAAHSRERASEQLLAAELETRIERAQHAVEAANARSKQLQAAHEQASARAAQAEERLERVSSELEQRRRELSAQREIDRSTELGLSDARALQASLEQQLAEARTEARGWTVRLQAAEAKASENERLRAEIDGLRAKIAELERTSAPRQEVDALKRKERDLLVRAQVMAQRISELTDLADENATLRDKLGALELAAARAKELEQRVNELEAQSFASRLHDAPETGDALPDDSLPTEPLPTVGATIERMLGEFRRRAKHEVVALADTNGFMIAASGDPAHQESLAAVTGLAEEFGQRARQLLPLGPVIAIEIADANGVSFRARLFQLDEQPLALTTLGPLSATDLMAKAAISSVTSVLGFHEAPKQ